MALQKSIFFILCILNKLVTDTAALYHYYFEYARFKRKNEIIFESFFIKYLTGISPFSSPLMIVWVLCPSINDVFNRLSYHFSLSLRMHAGPLPKYTDMRTPIYESPDWGSHVCIYRDVFYGCSFLEKKKERCRGRLTGS